jgi:hypothetical protein
MAAALPRYSGSQHLYLIRRVLCLCDCNYSQLGPDRSLSAFGRDTILITQSFQKFLNLSGAISVYRTVC